jgi:hypothetical protein
MKRILTVLATVLVATSLATAAADARGGGGGHGGGFGGGFGGGHMGGFGGGAHFGGIAGGAHLGGFNGDHAGIGGHPGLNRFGLHPQFAHRHGRFLPGYGVYGSYPGCYDDYNLHPNHPWPPACS